MKMKKFLLLILILQKTDKYRTHWPFMRDRRIDSYQQITKRFIDDTNLKGNSS